MSNICELSNVYSQKSTKLIGKRLGKNTVLSISIKKVTNAYLTRRIQMIKLLIVTITATSRMTLVMPGTIAAMTYVHPQVNSMVQ